MDSDLTLPATVAEDLGVDASDPKLPRLIGAASGAIRTYLNRPQLHFSAAYVERLPGLIKQVRLLLGLTPVVAVASVVLPDGSSLGASDYTLEDTELGALYRSVGWPYTGLVHAGLLYDAPAVGTEKKSIVVTYSGGWVTPVQAAGGGSPTRTLPYEIEEACIATVTSLYRGKGRDSAVASEALGDYSVSYRAPNSLIGVGSAGIIPDSVLAQLNPYRRLIT
jgi:hypothetical protein